MAKEKAPAFQFYPRDFWEDINVQEMVAHGWGVVGMYLRLMSWCWLEGGIPDDPERLRKLLSRTVKDWGSEWPLLSPCFISTSEGRLIHPRVEKERDKQTENRESAIRRGRNGAEKRWHKNAPAIAEPLVSQSPCNAEPIANDSFAVCSLQFASSNLSQEKSDSQECSATGLHEFLAGYPKKTKTDAAARAYVSIIESEQEHHELMAGLSRWLASDQWKRSLQSDGGRFVPDPDKFIFDRRYLEHPSPHLPPEAGAMSPGAAAAAEVLRKIRDREAA